MHLTTRLLACTHITHVHASTYLPACMQVASVWTKAKAVLRARPFLLLLPLLLVLVPVAVVRGWAWYTDYAQLYTPKPLYIQHSLDPNPCEHMPKRYPATKLASCPDIVRKYAFSTTASEAPSSASLLYGRGQLVWVIFGTRCSNPNVARLLRSLEAAGLETGMEIAVLGIGLEYRGLSMKLGVLHDYLRQVRRREEGGRGEGRLPTSVAGKRRGGWERGEGGGRVKGNKSHQLSSLRRVSQGGILS